MKDQILTFSHENYQNAKLEHEQQICTFLNTPNLKNIRGQNGAQSMTFMIDMLPHIWSHLKAEKRYSRFSWLDVGPGSGYGASLLASLHSGPATGYLLDVSVIDISRRYKPLVEHISDDIKEFIVGDIYKTTKTYDYVSASHVIEHVSEPARFVRRLQEIARKTVFILTPWKEREDLLTKGHINIFDEHFISELGSPRYKLLESMAWGGFLEPPYKMLFLELPGLASGG